MMIKDRKKNIMNKNIFYYINLIIKLNLHEICHRNL